MNNIFSLLQFFYKVYKLPYIDGLNSQFGICEFLVVFLLYNAEKENTYIDMSKISKCLQISRPATSQLSKKLENKGYIEKIQGLGNNKKTLYLRLTNDGRDIYDRKLVLLEKLFRQLTDNLGEKTFMELISSYDVFYSTLQNFSEDN